MVIVGIMNGTEYTLSLSGRLDVDSAHELRAAVRKIPQEITSLIVDLRELAYLSSAGLRELLICRKKFPDNKMRIINVQPEVFEGFEITGFSTIMPVFAAADDSASFIRLSFSAFLKKKADTEGDRPVVKTSAGVWTWRDIDICSQIVARDLLNIGVKKGTHVGISCANSINWIITFFAVQKLGGIAMLFNSALFPRETAEVAVSGDVTHLCCGDMPEVRDMQSFAQEIISSEKCPVQFIYQIGKNVDLKKRYAEYEEIKDHIFASSGSDDPCTVIFTSGSTGRPKGVILSSYNILNASLATMHNQTLNRSDKTCLILPMFHIFGLAAGLFANFLADSLICLPDDIHTSTLIDLIEREGCTVFHTVPTMMIALVNSRSFTPERCRTLRCTILSGSAATASQIKMFREKLPGEHFISSYGLSEMAPVSASDYDDTEEHLLYTVGKPVPNIEVKIQDPETHKDCRFNVQGEILVQGYNLTTGYYKVMPEDQSIDEEGWLHTGDLGWLTPEGYLVLTGRLKELIIRGGENVMPGEVESVISSLSGVNMVKVFGVPSDFFGEEVAACIVMDKGAAFDEEAVRSQLSERLAKFKIPAYYVVFESFPLLGTAKIDAVTLKQDMLKRLGKA